MTKTRALILMVFSFVLITGILFAQAPALPVYEGFNYPVGDLVGNAGWEQTGNNAAFPVQIEADSLTYAGLPVSTGGKVKLINASNAEDPGFDIVPTGSQTEASSVFASMILNVVNEGNTTGDYFFNFSSAGKTKTDYHSRIFIKKGSADGKYLLGVRNASSDAIQWETADRDIGTPVLVVVSYEFVVGEGNDVSRIWINSELGQGAPGTPSLTTVGSGTDLGAVGRVNIRQGSGNTDLAYELDELRVGSWTDVTPAGSGVNDWSKL